MKKIYEYLFKKIHEFYILGGEKDAEVFSMFVLSTLESLNLIALHLLISKNVSPGEQINSFYNILIFISCVAFNYFYFIYQKRFEKIIEYNFSQLQKRIIIFSFVSYILFSILFLLYSIFSYRESILIHTN